MGISHDASNSHPLYCTYIVQNQDFAQQVDLCQIETRIFVQKVKTIVCKKYCSFEMFVV